MKDLFLQSTAVFSSCGRFRYRLARVWDEALPRVLWVMLNPSTADASADDPTIRRCVNFARLWGAGSVEVVNLFAARATDPEQLARFADPVGPNNDAHIREVLAGASRVLAAWGAQKNIEARVRAVMALVSQTHHQAVECLGLTRQGQPRHPLYVAATVLPQTWRYRGELTP